jgi:hypothetical protein
MWIFSKSHKIFWHISCHVLVSCGGKQYSRVRSLKLQLWLMRRIRNRSKDLLIYFIYLKLRYIETFYKWIQFTLKKKPVLKFECHSFVLCIKLFIRKLILSLMQSTIFIASQPTKSNSLENPETELHTFIKLHRIFCVIFILVQANIYGFVVIFIWYTPELSGCEGS